MKFALIFIAAAGLFAQDIASKVKGMQKLDGFVPVYWEEKTGKLFLEVGAFGQELLYVTSLPAGVGSNDIGLDRGQIGAERIVRFERVGPKVLLVQPNYDFRATSGNPDEGRSVEQAFAQSVLWGFTVEAEQGGQVLVDATEFVLRDAHGVAGSLGRAKQGTYTVDAKRSAVYLPRTKTFPNNTELEATLTFTGTPEGEFIRSVTPSPDAVTVRQHHSFVRLPQAGYKPRAFDPRAGFFGIEFMDYSTPIGEPIRKRYIARHRLTREKPLVYYVDRGAPEPIRSALLDGAKWWTDAFAAAGFPNGFRVELLPEDADPMDIRYNVIQWVHRATRGWSYGHAVTDPRTGEILKGHVTLGSLRVRQDYLIAEGLLAPYESGVPADDKMLAMALARIRQLSAHELGHTLGLAHNYAAQRESVMDYPHPIATLNGAGAPSLEGAYAPGLGAWDKAAIAWGYGDRDEAISGAYKAGVTFITDADARDPGGAHPGAHLWDNGSDAVAELERVMAVRARALERFGENVVRVGQPLSLLEETLVPLYLGHRYQVEAAAKLVGGVSYEYNLRGDGRPLPTVLPAARQRRALAAVLATLSPSALTLPERIAKTIPPRAFGYPRNRETFPSRTGVTFDTLAPAESAANIVFGLLLRPERATRLVEMHARDASLPGLEDVLDAVLAATWFAPRVAGTGAEVQRVVDSVALEHLFRLGADERSLSHVRAIAHDRLKSLAARLNSPRAGDKAHREYAVWRIEQFLRNPKEFAPSVPVEPPPGQPIGSDDCEWIR